MAILDQSSCRVGEGCTESEYIQKIHGCASNLESQVEAVKSKQAQALELLKNSKFPDKSHEDWKYYDFGNVLNSSYDLCEFSEPSKEQIREYEKLISKFVYKETLNNYLVTVDGAYCPELSKPGFDQADLEILNFNDPEQLAKSSNAAKVVEEYFAARLDKEEDFFNIINTALMTNGFLLNVRDNFEASSTLQVLHISNKNRFNQTRSLINMGKNSKLKILVTYIGLEDAKYFTNAVIEANLNQGASLKLDKVQNESKESLQMYNLYASLDRDSNFEFNSYSIGAKSSRDKVLVDSNGENSEAKVNGLYVLSGERTSHHLVTMNHNVHHCSSDQVFKGLLYDKSRAEFSGIVNVEKDAQQISADQLNRNLLMSDEAHVDSRPQLNIEADDVKCSHGASIGQLNEEELFYLQSRGLEKDEAIKMLTFSFCEELISNIDLESARDDIANLSVRNLNRSYGATHNCPAKS